jgi:ribosome-associated protein
MKHDVPIKNGIVIPAHEIEITTSRSGGPGGQHVNKTSSRVTVRWNISTTTALDETQKQQVLTKLHAQLTTEGDLVIHSSASRSQHHNKETALERLAHEIRKALHVPKKRTVTHISKTVKQKRFETKKQHSFVKKMRRKPFRDDE